MTLYLLARVADRTVAIDTATVEAVVDLNGVVPAPGAGAAVRGLAALRSRVVTVVDARIAIGEPPVTAAARAVVTNVDGHHYAVLVDELEDVAELTVAPTASLWPASSRWRAVSRGVIDRAGEPIVTLDLAALIPGHVAA